MNEKKKSVNVCLIATLLIIVAGMAIAFTLGFANSPETDRHYLLSTELSVEENSEVDLNAIAAEIEAAVPGVKADIAENPSTLSPVLVMTDFDKAVNENAVADIIAAHDGVEAGEYTARQLSPSVTKGEYSRLAVYAVVILVLAFILMLIAFAKLRGASAAACTLGAVLSALLAVSLMALLRLPAGRLLFASVLTAMAAALILGFFSITEYNEALELGSKNRKFKEHFEDAEKKCTGRAVTLIVLIVIFAAAFIGCGLTLDAESLAAYAAAVSLGALAAVVCSWKIAPEMVRAFSRK